MRVQRRRARLGTCGSRRAVKEKKFGRRGAVRSARLYLIGLADQSPQALAELVARRERIDGAGQARECGRHCTFVPARPRPVARFPSHLHHTFSAERRGLEALPAGNQGCEKEGPILAGLIWGIIVVLFVLWLLGFAIHFGGGLIHLLLVIALVLLVFNIITGRGARV